MDQPPLPPHERPWRHPSELGPTRQQVDDGGPGTMTLAVATGAVAFVAVAVLLVAIVPQQSADRLSVSVTTAPVAAVRAVRADATTDSARARLVSVTRIPNEVSSVSLTPLDGLALADSMPDGSDPVMVLTEEYTYWVEWSALARLDLPEDSVVVDAGGALIGHIRDGHLLVAIDDD